MRREFSPTKAPFIIEGISCLTVSRDKDYRHSYKSGRLKYGFIYLQSGRLRNDFLGDTVSGMEHKAGDLIFIPKGCSYLSTYLEDDTKIKILQFDILCADPPSYLLSPESLDFFNTEEEPAAFFESEHFEKGHPFYCLSFIYKLLWRLDERRQSIPKKYRKLRPALTEIKKDFAANRPIGFYAELCNMSEVNFRRLFKEYTEKSPVEYRNRLRLEDARAKILSGEYNVSEAAEASGFSNLSFFISLYKRRYGHTPKAE